MHTKITSWDMIFGEGPIVATAIHHGHQVRDDVRVQMKLDDATRLLEEDPYTAQLTEVVDNQVKVYQSRFEYDLNRAPEEAVYQKPKDAWGLHIWKNPLLPACVERSQQEHHRFYDEFKQYLQRMKANHPRFVVLDIHSYNYRRAGKPADPNENPEVNVGTGTLNRARWGRLVDRFMKDLSAYNFQGRHLDVRENVKFKGRYLAEWVHTNFPESGCVLSLEFKKIFMDEWTGKLFPAVFEDLKQGLASTIPGLMEV